MCQRTLYIPSSNSFELGRRLDFADQIHDVLNLCLNLPEHAVGFILNEQLGIQLLGSTQLFAWTSYADETLESAMHAKKALPVR